MSDQVWRWLLKVNARTVFLLFVMLLCAALFVLSRQEADRPAVSSLSAYSAAMQTSPAVPGGGRRRLMDSLPDLDNPFDSGYLGSWLERREAARIAAEKEAARIAAEKEAARIAAEKEAARIAAEKEAARIAAEKEAARLATEQEAARLAAEQEAARLAAEAGAEAAPVAPAAAQDPPPPPPPPKVALLYRGMLVRTDGTRVGMVERDGALQAVAVGGDLFGYTVESADSSALTLRVAGEDGEGIVIPYGEVIEVDEVQ